MNYKPKSFHGNEGVVALTRWMEKMKTLFEFSLHAMKFFHMYPAKCNPHLVEYLCEGDGRQQC